MTSPAAAQAGLPIRAASSEVAREEQIGNFAYLDSRDDRDGSDRSSIVVTHDGYTPGHKGGVLSWSCGPEGLMVMFYFDRPMWATEDGRVAVRYRVDQGAPSQFEHWALLPGNRGAIIRAEHMGIFTRGVMPGKSVQIQVSDDAESTATYRFTLAGLRSGLSRLNCATQFH